MHPARRPTHPSHRGSSGEKQADPNGVPDLGGLVGIGATCDQKSLFLGSSPSPSSTSKGWVCGSPSRSESNCTLASAFFNIS